MSNGQKVTLPSQFKCRIDLVKLSHTLVSLWVFNNTYSAEKVSKPALVDVTKYTKKLTKIIVFQHNCLAKL